jgi:N-acetyl-gamma-glutamyl-phosphate reductase
MRVVVVGSRIAVVGASGYAGGEVLRLAAGHPEFEIIAATAHSQAGTPVESVHPHLVDLGLTFQAIDPNTLAGADLVFLALPHGESAALAASLPEHVKIVDLGADFRLRDAAQWKAYYAGEHAGTWTYGLPELPGQREAIAGSTRVAATGCYAVATILALAPLISSGLVSSDDVVVVAASGTTGAGRSLRANLLGSAVMSDLSGYKVGAHQHSPEMKQGSGARTLSFTPVLAPMPRGILSTVTARPSAPETTAEQARDVLAQAYRDEPFVRLLPAGVWPRTKATLGSNACHLQTTVDKDSGRVLVQSAIDNLGKGAAGQAVQCANIMLGLAETSGLSAVGVSP